MHSAFDATTETVESKVCFLIDLFSLSLLLCRQYQIQRENQEVFGTRTTLRKLESLIRLSKGEEKGGVASSIYANELDGLACLLYFIHTRWLDTTGSSTAHARLLLREDVLLVDVEEVCKAFED